MNTILLKLSKTQSFGASFARFGIAIIFLWIGALKFVPYEADSITPFVANSPFMSFFYNYPNEYKEHMNHEGELNTVNREWHQRNNTYGYSNGLGIVEITFAVLILLNIVSPKIGFVGALMAFLTPIVTYSFLIFTPETWVTNLGDSHYGFPYLSGAGRLVLKDICMMACGYIAMVDSAKTIISSEKYIAS